MGGGGQWVAFKCLPPADDKSCDENDHQHHTAWDGDQKDGGVGPISNDPGRHWQRQFHKDHLWEVLKLELLTGSQMSTFWSHREGSRPLLAFGKYLCDSISKTALMRFRNFFYMFVWRTSTRRLLLKPLVNLTAHCFFFFSFLVLALALT